MWESPLWPSLYNFLGWEGSLDAPWRNLGAMHSSSPPSPLGHASLAPSHSDQSHGKIPFIHLGLGQCKFGLPFLYLLPSPELHLFKEEGLSNVFSQCRWPKKEHRFGDDVFLPQMRFLYSYKNSDLHICHHCLAVNLVYLSLSGFKMEKKS